MCKEKCLSQRYVNTKRSISILYEKLNFTEIKAPTRRKIEKRRVRRQRKTQRGREEKEMRKERRKEDGIHPFASK